MVISFIGIGRLGGALALALASKGHHIEFLTARNKDTAEKIAGLIGFSTQIIGTDELEKLSNSQIIFITTQDGEIAKVAAESAKKISGKPIVFHTSGSLSSEILSPLENVGCRTASFHPLVSVSDAISGADKFSDVYFCLEGDAEAVEIGEKIVAELEGNPFKIETKFKPLYHASAVASAGHLTALFSVAVEMLAACGLNPVEAQKILLPLAKSTVKNLELQNPADALTGTFARADVETLKRHLEAMKNNVSAENMEIWRQLGLRSLHLVSENENLKEKIAEMREILAAEVV